jgi:hypothetical protein
MGLETGKIYETIEDVYKQLIGNGGLSIRRKSKMLEILDQCKNEYNLHAGTSEIVEQQHNNLPEDVFFSLPCKNIKVNKPTYNQAVMFSNESTYNNNSFGVHKPWLHMSEYESLKKNKTCPGIIKLSRLNQFEMFSNENEEKYTAIIVEPRITEALPFVLQNFLENLNEQWNIIIFHGKINSNFVNLVIDTKLHSYRHRINTINLQVENLSINDYNNLLLSKDFYNYIPTEVFLVFQIDSLICASYKDLINEFIQYDYVGAPWKNSMTENLIESCMYIEPNTNKPRNKFLEYNEDPNEMNKRLIGNGGLSLRRKSKMLEILEKCPINKKIPEDIYFSIPCNGIKMNKPSYEKAMQFSMESIYSDISFGIHKPWLYFNDDQILKKNETCPGIFDLYKLNNQYPNNHIDIIVARYNEDLDWMNEIPFSNYKYIIYNKGDNDNFEKKNLVTAINF